MQLLFGKRAVCLAEELLAEELRGIQDLVGSCEPISRTAARQGSRSQERCQASADEQRNLLSLQVANWK